MSKTITRTEAEKIIVDDIENYDMESVYAMCKEYMARIVSNWPLEDIENEVNTLTTSNEEDDHVTVIDDTQGTGKVLYGNKG